MRDLAQIKLFADLPDKELKNIGEEFKDVVHPAGSEIMHVGSKGAGFMVIYDGGVLIKLPDGRTRELGPGDHFGEMALLDAEGRSVPVVAVGEVSLGVLPAWSFKAFLAEHPEVAYRLMQGLSQRLREVESHSTEHPHSDG
ncbi:MAG: family transcriptional regulator, cyclic receptor protein [Chloroflexota bacterium]|nr:family transcriptional regulator, cyclic receptor protein [Chloroflexota bacterium]